jgi:hypothetical protein
MQLESMKKQIVFIVLIIMMNACAPQAQYFSRNERREGKKKIKYYNDVFFGRQKQGVKN